MFNKHWKKFLLSLCAMLWSGCSDDSSSDSKELIACEFEKMCPEYGVLYDCENEEDKISGNYENCTMSTLPCSESYFCKDEVVCFEDTDNNTTIFNCRDEKDNRTIYTEDEFKSKYYVENDRRH